MSLLVTLLQYLSIYVLIVQSFQPINNNKLIKHKIFNRKSVQIKMGLLDGLKKIVSGNALTSNPSIENTLLQENSNLLKLYQEKVLAINDLEESYEELSNDDLSNKTREFKQRLSNGETLESIQIEAYAVVREAAWRVLEMRHFDVQLLGGLALHEGRLAEMATGEGKTLVAILPIYLNALSGNGAIIVTNNDYLARRDGEMMGQVFRFLNLSVGIIQSYYKEDLRKQAYSCDITYLSNQELGFDYLRDNLVISTDNIVQIRPFNFCIVDEADSILIDEARTPLIISRLGNAPTEKYLTAAQIVKKYLKVNEHYEVNEKDAKIELTSQGFKYTESLIGKSLYDLSDPWAFYIINAIKAKEILKIDKDYVIVNGVINIVDSFTGRVLDGRRFTDGLQQSLEAKEGLKISGETQVVAKITYQSLFKLFPKLSGMTGTASTDMQEFYDVYNLKVISIPTALPVARRDNPDAIFRSKNGKMKALLRNVLSQHQKGRPILIGTTSIENSEEIYNALKDIGIKKVKLLNARPENIEKESEIVSQAGRLGSITVATNMAGRGTDIILGGSSKGIAKIILKQLLSVQLGLLDSTLYDVIEEEIKIDDDSEDGEEESDDYDEQDSNKELSDSEQFLNAIKTNKKSNKIELDYEEPSSIIPSIENTLQTLDNEILNDPDILALPSINQILKYNQIDLNFNNLTTIQILELELKKNIISVSDIITTTGVSSTLSIRNEINNLLVEDVITLISESIPLINNENNKNLIKNLKYLRLLMKKLIVEIEKNNLSAEKERIKKLGGLYVIGTDRHESRRIDLQLRGRAGRQGDPGSSRFFLSLEDDIFKIFGADKLASVMENFRVGEDMPIESELVVQALDKVQTQVEDYYRGIRKQVYKLDEITSLQRSVVYKQRRSFLTSSDDEALETFTQFCLKTLKEIYDASFITTGSSNKPTNNLYVEKLISKSLQFFPNLEITLDEIKDINAPDVLQVLQSRLLVAITKKQLEIDEASVNSYAFLSFFRYLSMVQTDESWCRQLTRLDLLKEEMVLQSFTAERDVLEVYKEKASKLFESLLDDVRRNTVYSLFIYKPKK